MIASRCCSGSGASVVVLVVVVGPPVVVVGPAVVVVGPAVGPAPPPPSSPMVTRTITTTRIATSERGAPMTISGSLFDAAAAAPVAVGAGRTAGRAVARAACTRGCGAFDGGPYCWGMPGLDGGP